MLLVMNWMVTKGKWHNVHYTYISYYII